MERNDDEKQIIKYLLGESDEDEQKRVEQRMLTDDAYFELLLATEDDLMDDYLSGSLAGGKRERFAAHFLSSPERREKLRFAMTLRKYVSAEATADHHKANHHNAVSLRTRTTWWKQLVAAPSLRLAAAAIIVIAVGLGTWRVFFHQSDISKGVAALNKAYREQRPVESRISMLDYAPFPVTRGSEQARTDKTALNRAERILLDEVAERPNASSYHALGRLYLAENKFDEAINQFEEALKLDDKNAQLHGDLGAALLEKAKAERSKDESGKSLEDFARSLEHLTRALELNGSLLEARFNRALCYQYMSLPQQAEEDWRAYLEKDPNSNWADEARQNLKLLEEQKQKGSQDREQLYEDFLSAYRGRDDERAWKIISLSHTITGNLVIDGLLDSYLRLAAKSLKVEADSMLQALSYAGELESKKAGDRFTSDLARFYESATPKQREILTQAHELAKSAHVLSTQSNKYDSAIETYNKAKQLFVQAGDGCEARFIEYRVGNCYLRQPNTERGLSTFELLARSYEQSNYHWLLAQSLNSLADAHISLNQYSKALDYSSRALKLSEQIYDTNGMLSDMVQQAILHQALGNYSKSSDLLQRSLDLASKSHPEPRGIWVIYGVMAVNYESLNFYHAALGCSKEALRIATEMKRPLYLSRSYAEAARIYGKLASYDEAINNAQFAFEIGRDIADETVGLDMMAFSSLQLGYLFRQSGKHGEAISSYDRVIQLYNDIDYHTYLYEAHKGKLLSYIVQGDDDSAERELLIALKLFEQYRFKIVEESNRDRFFDVEQDTYDVAMDFAYSRMNNPQAAFEYSEISRARSLLDLKNAGAQMLDKDYGPDLKISSVSQPLPVSKIQERMPDRAQILQYAALNDKLFIWVVSKTTISSVEENVALNKLNEKVINFLRLVSSPSESADEGTLDAARELYGLLISPVESLLDSEKQLCIVPDKILNHLPFDALVAPNTSRYLVEDYCLIFSPSSNIFLSCSDAARARGGVRDETVLSVGNPRFDRSAFPSLSDLPSASREAEQVAACYNSSPALTGDNARKRQVKSEIERAEIVHLAMHYVIDGRSPLLSKLVLAKESAGASQPSTSNSTLQAHEIYRLKLPRTRLIVLSACQTGIENYFKGEGAIGIARPFIAAGTPLVVSSLWPVDSGSTAELMIGFHRHRKSDGLSSADALRQAQLDMLNSPNRNFHQPYYWASFNVTGGYAAF